MAAGPGDLVAVLVEGGWAGDGLRIRIQDAGTHSIIFELELPELAAIDLLRNRGGGSPATLRVRAGLDVVGKVRENGTLIVRIDEHGQEALDRAVALLRSELPELAAWNFQDTTWNGHRVSGSPGSLTYALGAVRVVSPRTVERYPADWLGELPGVVAWAPRGAR